MGELKNFRTGGGLPIWSGVIFAGGGGLVPHYIPWLGFFT